MPISDNDRFGHKVSLNFNDHLVIIWRGAGWGDRKENRNNKYSLHTFFVD